jgi:hypothetical protein
MAQLKGRSASSHGPSIFWLILQPQRICRLPLFLVLLHANVHASTPTYDMEPGDAAQDARRANDVMRQHWNDAIREELSVPSYYTSVAVLLIHWADRLDESLESGKQVR